jgi:hypothetical protein
MEHIENLMGTHWELGGNTLGTTRKMKKTPPLAPNPEEKKLRSLECMMCLLIGCMQILFLKLAFTIFGLN